jgi:hypothetical protein
VLLILLPCTDFLIPAKGGWSAGGPTWKSLQHIQLSLTALPRWRFKSSAIQFKVCTRCRDPRIHVSAFGKSYPRLEDTSLAGIFLSGKSSIEKGPPAAQGRPELSFVILLGWGGAVPVGCAMQQFAAHY